MTEGEEDEIARRIFEFLQKNKDSDHTITMIADELGIDRVSVGNFVRAFTVTSKIKTEGRIILTRYAGKAGMYRYIEEGEGK